MRYCRKLKKVVDLRLDSMADSKDQIFLSESREEIIFSESNRHQNIIFSENVKKYILSKEVEPVIIDEIKMINNEYRIL